MYKRKIHKKRLIGLIAFSALFLALAGVIVYTTSSEAHTNNHAIKVDTKYPQVEVATTVNTKSGYTIEFPLLHIKEIDQVIKSYLTNRISNFTKNNQGKKLVITYDIAHFSKQTLSINFTEQLNKKSNQTIMKNTINIDLLNKEIIQLENLFASGNSNEYLEILSRIASNELKNNEEISLSDKEIDKVTAPMKENFKEFIVFNNSIVFILKPNNNVDIPLAISKSILEQMLRDPYKSGDQNADVIKDIEPSDIITELPKKEIQVPLDKKVIALTFDDGPKAGTTNIILDALKKYNANATFFVLGSMAEKNPELLKEIAERGHEIGSHSWDHPQLTKMGNKDIQDQIERTKALIQKITGYAPTVFRPPYGSINQAVYHCLGDTPVAMWDIDTEDWRYRNKNYIVQSVMDGVGDGKTVLMHDIYPTSAEAAVEVIRQLKTQGYEIVSVSELKEIQKQRQQAQAK